VLEINAEGMVGAPHISCIGSTREGIRAVLEQYRSHGIRHLVALRGDLPSGAVDVGEFRYANELVKFIREETGDWFHIDVPRTRIPPAGAHAHEDIDNFFRKYERGELAITQYFFNADAYWSFVDACADRGVERADRAGDHADPQLHEARALLGRVRRRDPALDPPAAGSYGDDVASIRAFGLDVVTDLCASLLERGAPGCILHAQSGGLTSTIWQRLGL
jgi:methylenetetrahydrofolate reductase (NADPH)